MFLTRPVYLAIWLLGTNATRTLFKLTHIQREFFYSGHNQNGFTRKSFVALRADGGLLTPVLSRLGKFSLLVALTEG